MAPENYIANGSERETGTRSVAGLEPHGIPFSRRTAAHLLRRTSFSGSAADVSSLVGRNPTEVIDEIIYAARVAPDPPNPPWAYSPPPPRSAPASVRTEYNQNNSAWIRDYRDDWVAEMLNESFREKMVLFWHDHFATEIGTYRYAFFAFHYLKLLRTHAFQYFKTFVHAVGIEPAMLIYLNGNTNTLNKPNENYARELLELFTMSPTNAAGDANYTEDDIKELARMLTGWVVSEDTGLAEYIESRHDTEGATIFDISDTYDYQGVIDLLFNERPDAIATYIASKLYSLFVYTEPDPAIVSGLAQHLIESDFAIFSTVGLLLKSQHFFDEATMGTQVKSPVEFVLQLARTTGRNVTEQEVDRLERLIRLLEQVLLDPPSVSGWTGHHNWISTNSLPLRWIYSDYLIFGGSGLSKADLLPMAAELVNPEDPFAAFYLPTAIAEHLLAVRLETVDIPDIEEEFGGNLDNFPIPNEIIQAPAHVRNLAKIFLAGAPWYEWHLNNFGSNDRLLGFVQHLVQYPEYQLM